MKHPSIRLSSPRSKIRLTLPDTRVFEAPQETPLGEILDVAYPDASSPVLAAIVDGELRELAYPLDRDVQAIPVFLTDSDGMRIYCRSLSFLMVVAAAQAFPGARIYIDYSVPHGGYFCRTERRAPFTAAELGKIRDLMLKMVSEDRPVVRRRCTLEEIRAVFEARGEETKLRLWEHHKGSEHLHIYELAGVSDYFFGYMVPSTGKLRVFGLEPFSNGFILRFPRRENPTKLAPPRRFTGTARGLRRVWPMARSS